jgi:H+/Cl- antiporter ClcA
VPPGFTIFFLLVCGLFAMAAGALAGVLASFFLRLPIRGVWKDAVLGLLVFFLVFFAPILVSRLGPLLINSLREPVWVGLVVAALCPIVRQVLRFRNVRSNRTTNSRV